MTGIFFYLFLFFIYSFAGWFLETLWGIIKHKRFRNTGLLSGPFCILYGFTAVFLSIFLKDLRGFWLFLFSMVWASVFEWVSGHILERIFHKKLWDYSEYHFHVDGYISLYTSVFWGILGFAVIRFINPILEKLVALIPKTVSLILLIGLFVLLIIDLFTTYTTLYASTQKDKWKETNSFFIKMSLALAEKIEKRINKAYPKAKTLVKEKQKPLSTTVFAAGCGFYKLVWLFMIGAFLGDIVETIFCRITAGVWMSRSSVVWGPFSIVWGLAIALATVLLYRYQKAADRKLFLIGTLLGGAYEYLCSVFTEICFGKVFWDYSKIPFNLGGRINLLYCFFWGIAAVVWLKNIYPVISDLIEKIPVSIGKVMTWIMVIFMTCNICVSAIAMTRYSERNLNIPAQTAVDNWFDLHYDDEIMERIYPNALNVE